MQTTNTISPHSGSAGQDIKASAGGGDVLRMDPVSDSEFRAIMARQSAPATASAGSGAMPADAAGMSGKSLGERIVHRATALSEELYKDQQYISKTLEQAARAGNSTQLMKAMLALSDYQTRVQFISKAASKATSAIDQLTKLQ